MRIANWKEASKISEKYMALKRRLESIQETKDVQEIAIKDEQAIDYFETCKSQINDKLAEHEESLAKLIANMERAKATLLQKLAYVEDKLDKARIRAQSRPVKKTKAEILIEKEITDLLREYSQLRYVSKDNENTLFPDYKKLLPSMVIEYAHNDPVPSPEPAPTPAPKKTPIETPKTQPVDSSDNPPAPFPRWLNETECIAFYKDKEFILDRFKDADDDINYTFYMRWANTGIPKKEWENTKTKVLIKKFISWALAPL